MRLVYSSLWCLLVPLLLLRLWWRGRMAPAYRLRWFERLGYMPFLFNGGHNGSTQVIWMHTVSVGETLAAEPLVREFLLCRPECRLLMTCTTPTGSEQIRRLYGDKVLHCYMPFDVRLFLRPLFQRLSIKAIVLMETEIWPNLLHEADSHKVPVLLLNARLSEKSERGYNKVGGLLGGAFQEMTAVLAQDEASASRFIQLGVPAGRVQVCGTLKYDLQLSADLSKLAEQWRQQWLSHDDAQVLVAASTHAGEDEVVLKAYQNLRQTHEGLKLLIVPRHPERFDDVHHLMLATGLPCARRSQAGFDAGASLMLGDSMGEMQAYCELASVVLVGGSWVNGGGHNPIEPAALAKPIIMGPSVFNFEAVVSELVATSALVQVADEAALIEQLQCYLSNVSAATQAGEAGRALVASSRGALQKQLAVVLQHIPSDEQ